MNTEPESTGPDSLGGKDTTNLVHFKVNSPHELIDGISRMMKDNPWLIGFCVLCGLVGFTVWRLTAIV